MDGMTLNGLGGAKSFGFKKKAQRLLKDFK